MDPALYIAYVIGLVAALVLILWFASRSEPEPTMQAIPENSFPFPVFIINLERKPERYAYVSEQLDNIGITGYERFIGTDGFRTEPAEMQKLGLTEEFSKKKGLAGCASSHIRMWRHIVENNLGWTLILEDDAHFHPEFMKLFSEYWKNVPAKAKIVFPGFCAPDFVEHTPQSVVCSSPMCLQGYMVNAETAKYLLDNLLPMNEPVDIEIVEYFRHRRDTFIFNGNVRIQGIRPNDYKDANGKKCTFNGIIYQNQRDQGSTIHQEQTVY